MKIYFGILLNLLTLTVAHAHNNLFLPSDAYFSVAVKHDFIKKLETKGKVEIAYTRYSKSLMLCGYAGLKNVRIEGVSEVTRKNLQSTLEKLFSDEPEKARIIETENGPVKYFPILIYNKDFDFSKYPIGLKFNENFISEQTDKAKRGHSVDDRVDSKKLLDFDQEHAKSVRALDVKSIPKDLTAFMGVDEPIVIDGSKIVFVVLLGGESRDLQEHAERKSGLEKIIISSTISRTINK